MPVGLPSGSHEEGAIRAALVEANVVEVMRRGEVEAGATVTAYADQPGFCRSVPLAEIAQHGHVLTPGRHVGAEEGRFQA